MDVKQPERPADRSVGGHSDFLKYTNDLERYVTTLSTRLASVEASRDAAVVELRAVYSAKNILHEGLDRAIQSYKEVTVERDRALSDLAALRLAQAWRPISEAPKDGSKILVRVAGRFLEEKEFMMVMRWRHHNGVFIDGINPGHVTHFMPLPTPPAQKEG